MVEQEEKALTGLAEELKTNRRIFAGARRMFHPLMFAFVAGTLVLIISLIVLLTFFTGDTSRNIQILIISGYVLLACTALMLILFSLLYVRQRQKIFHLETHDIMTGLLDRSAMLELLNLEFERAVRYSRPLSLIYLDVDYFKFVNDHYGYPAGDKILRKIADVLNRVLRKSDIGGRYGGDVFIVYLPETPLSSAESTAEKLRRMVHEEMKNTPGHASISLGVAEVEPGMKESKDLLVLAENRLKYAKKRGRDCVVSISPAQPGSDEGL